MAKKELKFPHPNCFFVRNFSYLHIMKQERQINSSKTEPTKSELEILKVLWQLGPSTVRQVNIVLNEQSREVHYTSTLKLMQIMMEKELLKRNEDNMTHVYMAAVEEQKTKGELVDKFVSNLFEGSASKLMMHLVGTHKTSLEELEAIRKILDEVSHK